MEIVNEKVVALESAQILESKLNGAYNCNLRMINDLKERNFPIYWDLLLAKLTQSYSRMSAFEGDVTFAYSDRIAKSTLDIRPIQEVRNEYSRALPTYDFNNNIIPFPESCLDIAPDGSYELNEVRLKEYALNKNTYEIPEDLQQSIDACTAAFETSIISPRLIAEHTYNKDGKYLIYKLGLLRAMGCKPVGDQKRLA